MKKKTNKQEKRMMTIIIYKMRKKTIVSFCRDSGRIMPKKFEPIIKNSCLIYFV